jgi:hypothetical protein
MLYKVLHFFLYSGFQKTISLFFTSILIILLDKEIFGIYNLFYSFGNIIVTILTFEIVRAFQAKASFHEKKIIPEFLSLFMLLYLVICIFFVVWKMYLANFFFSELKNYSIFYFLIFTFLLINHKFLLHYFLAKKEIKKLILLTLLFPGLNFISIFLFIFIKEDFLGMFFLSNIFSVFFIIKIFKNFFVIKLSLLKKVFLNFKIYFQKSFYYYFISLKDQLYTLVIFGFILSKDLISVANISFLLFIGQIINIFSQVFLNIFINKSSLTRKESFLILPIFIFISYTSIIILYSSSWLVDIFYSKYSDIFNNYGLLALNFVVVTGLLGITSVNIVENHFKIICTSIFIYLSIFFMVFFIFNKFFVIEIKFFLFLIISSLSVNFYIIFSVLGLRKYIFRMKYNCLIILIYSFLPLFSNVLTYYILTWFFLAFVNYKNIKYFLIRR